MNNFKKLIFGFLMVMMASLLLANDFNSTLSQHDSTDSVGSISGSSNSEADENAKITEDEELPDYGYVRVNSSLNVRTGPWETIIGSLYNNNKVQIIGKVRNWYKIKHNGKTAYVHSRYVSSRKGAGLARSSNSSSPSRPSSSGNPLVTVSAKGSVQQKVVAAAQNLVSKYSKSSSFPYHSLTKGGRLGCAQVVTTALMAAGVNTGIQLGVLSSISKLKNLGWKQVKVPPYQAGDVITWSTYDRNKNGRKDPDTHIGIVMTSGNSVQAMSNSSSRKKPNIHSATYCPISRVLRKS